MQANTEQSADKKKKTTQNQNKKQNKKKTGLGWTDKQIKVNLFLGFLPEQTFLISWPSAGALCDPQVGFLAWLPCGAWVWADGEQGSEYLCALPREEQRNQQIGGLP